MKYPFDSNAGIILVEAGAAIGPCFGAVRLTEFLENQGEELRRNTYGLDAHSMKRVRFFRIGEAIRALSQPLEVTQTVW